MIRRRWHGAPALVVAAMVMAAVGLAAGSAWAAPMARSGLTGSPGPVPVLPLPGRPEPPDRDPFYRAPHVLDDYEPGDVLRSRAVTVVGLTTLASSVRAYQLLYRTTDAGGHPIATVTTLLLPTVPAPGRRNLVSYHTAEDSLTSRCSPSYTLRTNSGAGTPVEAGAIAALLARGWDVVVPDYEGPRSEFAVGPLEGRAALDSIRAAERFEPAGLDGTRTPVGMMGYSGGAIPTIWANALAHDYAPEVNLRGIAAGGLTPNPQANLAALDGTAVAGAIFGVSVAVDRAYPGFDLDSILNERGRALAARDARDGDGCSALVVNAPFARISDYTHYPNARALLAVPEVKRALDHLDLISGPRFSAPSYLLNAVQDEITIIKPVDELVAANCTRGATIDYHREQGEHGTGAGEYLLPGMQFLRDRFAGQPAPDNCPARD